MTKTFITGANKGLGYETARRLIEAGHDVWIGARDPERGRIAAQELGANIVQLDVTDDASVATAAEILQDQAGHIDVLINNAGILGAVVPAEEVTVDEVKSVFDTNVLGVVRVTRAMLPLLQAAEAPSVINVSSGLGSFALTQDPDRVESQFPLIPYCSSKSAVTMLTMQYAKALPGIKFNAVDPGQTATDLTGHAGQPVEQGTDAVVAIATLGAAVPTGTFTDRHGVVPW
jgi:NAD(P)-dependent dehydrogenase (short-subunit alcohol dehydrogenase family)